MIENYKRYINKLVKKGGPEKKEYGKLNETVRDIYNKYKHGDLSDSSLSSFRESFDKALSTKTVQGHAFMKPHGYPGDFEVMDRLYQGYISNDPNLRKWDIFVQSLSAPIAVRNRKSYLLTLLKRLNHVGKRNGEVRVLNVASGPNRGVSEFLASSSSCNIRFDCIDTDDSAIKYAREVCQPYLDRLNFYEENAFRFKNGRGYQLIWSAGLFDYLDDRSFKVLLRHLLTMLDAGGELVIGNFSDSNPTQPYMEVVCDWNLHHRSADKMEKLARQCSIHTNNIRVQKESEGVNLFLHVEKSD